MKTSRPARPRPRAARLSPGDRICLVTAGFVLAAITLRLPSRPSLLEAWLLHAALFAGYAGLAGALARRSDARWSGAARGLAVVAVMFTLYSTLARVAFEVGPWNADAFLDRADRLLFAGRSPALEAERLLRPALVEPLAFVYALFIPYLYLSIGFGLLGRAEPRREQFVTGLACTYGLSFVGYLLLPARGPIVHQAAEFAAPLQGGFFLRTVVASIDAMGGPHGAFPSLHVAASTYFCLFDLRDRPSRSWLYLPVVVLIAISTVFIRYHYAVDVVAGVLIALIALRAAGRWSPVEVGAGTRNGCAVPPNDWAPGRPEQGPRDAVRVAPQLLTCDTDAPRKTSPGRRLEKRAMNEPEAVPHPPHPRRAARRRRVLTALVLAVALGAGTAPAASSGEARALKAATLVPAGSSWHRILRESFREWERASKGTLTVRVFPSGVAGDDAEMVRKLRLGQLDLAVLSAVGLAEIAPDVYALGVPMAYDSPAEADYVLERMRPGLESQFAAQGFVALSLFESGWVRFFTAEAAPTPDRLRSLPLLVSAGENARELWRDAGFRTAAVEGGRVLPALESGDIRAMGLPPQAAVLSQSYLHLPHMTAMPWQLVLSGLVMRRSVWEERPDALRAELRRTARELGARLETELREGSARDIEAMRGRGLEVVPVDAASKREWQRVAAAMYPRIRGGVVPAGAFDEAMRHRDQFRTGGH